VTVRVRPFADRDYLAFSRIWRVCEAELVDAAVLRSRDSRWDRARYEKVRIVAVDEEDVPLGYGELRHEPSRFEPRRYFVRLGVDPAKRRRGIGAALWDAVAAELDERSAHYADLWTREHTACASFVTDRGFHEVAQVHALVSAVAAAPLPTPATRERLAASGVHIATLRDLAVTDSDAFAKAHALHTESRFDQPGIGRVSAVTFADWKAHNVDDPRALPDAYFIAAADGGYVGQTTARRSATEEDVLEIDVTGVRPSHRRRGIARALKLELHAYARAHGFHEIHTSTARENVAMVELNTRLGYVIVESIGGYELAIPSSP